MLCDIYRMENKDAWQPDQYLEEFDKDSFDVETHATEILKKGNINEEVAKLSSSLASLDTLIEQHVTSHYSDLLSRAVASSELEQSLGVMSTHINSLLMSSERLTTRLRDPYEKIRAGTKSLSRLQETTDILRRVIRILQLSKKLAGYMGHQGEGDLTKAASHLYEVAGLLAEDVAGVEVVEGEARKVRQWRLEVERQAEGLMTRGMSTGNQTQLATGLQVFYNLGTLPAVLDTFLADLHGKLRAHWTESLDIKRMTESSASSSGSSVTGPGKVSGPVAGNTAAFRSSLWTNIDNAVEAVHSHMVQLWLLQRLLSKKVDPVTHQPFISSLPNPNIVHTSWTKVCTIIKDCLSTAQAKSNFVKQTFEGEYPKLVKLYEELWTKLKQTSSQYTNTVQIEFDATSDLAPQFGLRDEMEESLRESLSQFEHAYLARSLSRLFDPINLMFSGQGQPSLEEINTIISVINSELNIASVDARLLSSVTRNTSKAVSLFCVKCEGCLDTEASQVIGQPSPAQCQNINILNLMAEFTSRLSKVEGLQKAGEEVSKLMVAGLEPLLLSINDSVEAILLTIHKEDFSGNDGDSASPAPACSLYMRELQTFLERIAKDFLSTFTCRDFLSVHLHSLAERTIEKFVLQGSLVRPLGTAGALRLASDCAQLEFALSTILGPSGQSSLGPTGLIALGSSYRLLRAFRSLLFLTPADMASFSGLGSVLPHSTALHLLISRCPEVVASPAESLGWSLARYTTWLEEHSQEKERLLMVQGALEAYVRSARERQDKSFVPQYPVMIDILQRGLSSC